MLSVIGRLNLKRGIKSTKKLIKIHITSLWLHPDEIIEFKCNFLFSRAGKIFGILEFSENLDFREKI